MVAGLKGYGIKKVGGYLRYIIIPVLVFVFLQSESNAASPQLIITLESVKAILGQAGPALSAILFILAGIFYAIGQMLPPDKKANFHTTAVNIIIGAIVVAVLSTAATGLAGLSTHILANLTQINSTI